MEFYLTNTNDFPIETRNRKKIQFQQLSTKTKLKNSLYRK